MPHRVPCTESHHSKSRVDLFLFLVRWNAFKQLSGKSLKGDLSFILNNQFLIFEIRPQLYGRRLGFQLDYTGSNPR